MSTPDLAPLGVAGVGRSGPRISDPRSIPEIVLEAVESALADATCGYDDVDAVVTASVDLFDGLTASNIAVTEVVGAVMRPETRIAGDGLLAAIHAACQLWAGAYETVLVVAHSKPSMAPADLTPWAMDPIHLQPLGASFTACAGLQARVLTLDDPDAEGRWAERAARLSTLAGRPTSPAEVSASSVVASPLRERMRAPLADGAYAAVLSRGEASVLLRGAGHDLCAHSPGDRDLRHWDGLTRAAGRAYAVAGIDDPADAFGCVEPACLYPHEEDLFTAATGTGPDTPVSPTGGLFGGAVPVGAGLSRLVEATRALRAEPSLRRVLAHGTWGPAGQGQALTILEAA
ncbi:MAG: hypothetical protein IT198_17435 [Acidimicrobiia bacterium]|nr:hypothetical protein [Acidimicrobiia bacterium]